MKTKNYYKTIVCILIAVVFSFIFSENTYASGEKVDLLFTSDLHSYVESYDKKIDGVQKNIGGFARLKTLIDDKRKENPDTLVIDCGDIVMGTLPQALMDTEAVELRLLSQFGYDAITYGNHEFDYGAKALADMYEKALETEKNRPEFVICNVDWNATDEYTTVLRTGMEKYGINDYVMIDKGGVKIAITGVLGIDAIKCAPTCELTFKDPIESVKETVKKIKEVENPDMIVCLSHSGTGSALGKTEDEELAKAVPDLDVIVSGHTHTVLMDGITIGDTHILSCGAYGVYTGSMSFTKKENGRWNMDEYKLILMDDSISEDEGVLNRIDEVNAIIDEKILKPYGISATDVIAQNKNIDFEDEQSTYDLHTEMKLCNLLSDSYRYMANTTPVGQKHPFDVSVVPSGTVRGSFTYGDITVADAFRALSLGQGPDGNVGYPLVELYLTGKELRTVAEVDASISDLMTTARLYTSGVAFEFNPNRMILNKIVDVWCTPAFLSDSYEKLDDKKLYHIVTDSYSMSMLGAVTDMSKGLLSVIPKDENGDEITNFENCIIYDSDGNELKAWVALEKYLDSFSGDETGMSQVPEYYASYLNRKVVTDSHSPRAMFKNTSVFFYAVVAIIIVLVIIVVFVFKSIRKSRSKKKVFK